MKFYGEVGLAELLVQIKNNLNSKVNKVEGKGLSTNDYTTEEKTKLAGIAANANNYTYTLPVAGSVLGGIKSGSDITVNSSGNVTVNNNAITTAKLASDAVRYMFENQVVETSAWAASTTYADYGFAANISCTNVTADMFPQVVFSPSDAESGNFASVCNSGAGIVTIYAKEKPTATVTIPSIVVLR